MKALLPSLGFILVVTSCTKEPTPTIPQIDGEWTQTARAFEKALDHSEYAQKLKITSISAVGSETSELKYRASLYWKEWYTPTAEENQPNMRYEIRYYRDGRLVVEHHQVEPRRRVVLPMDSVPPPQVEPRRGVLLPPEEAK